MGARMRAHDWSGNPLGPPAGWPASLRAVVSLLLGSQFPMFVAWGPDLRLLYNDAYAATLGEKHPGALAAPFEEVWAELSSVTRPIIAAVLGGEAVYHEDRRLIIGRSGADEEAWFTFSYSPIEDEHGQVAGIFCTSVETTARMREAQRRMFIAELDERLRGLDDPAEILSAGAEALGRHFDADRAHWVLIDVAQDRMEFAHEWGRPGVPRLDGIHRLADLGAPLLQEMRAGELIVFEGGFPEALMPPKRFRSEGVVGSALCAPLLRGGEWQAALCIHALSPRRWRDDERQLSRDVAERAWNRAQRARAEAQVRISEARLRALVSATNDIVFWLNPDWSELRLLDGAEFSPDASKPDLSWLELLSPDEQAHVRARIQRAGETGEVLEIEHPMLRADGSVGWISSRAVPFRDDVGEVIEWIGVATDVTEARRARQTLEETAERLQLATEAAEVGFWDIDPATETVIWSPRMKQMYGISEDAQITTADIRAGVHPDDSARVWAGYPAMLDPARRAVYECEYRTVTPDGQVRWVSAKGRGIFDRNGRCVRAVGVNVEITERKAFEERLRLMVNELNHRVKNSLATVQAIVAQTLRPGAESEEVRAALTARLVALAEAHDVLTAEKWSGAELAGIARQAAAPYLGLSGASPFEIAGPSVFLPPKTAIAVALAFHELATNAAKYGALSTPGGRVSIAWTIDGVGGGRRLRLTWRETGGPPVRAPERTGFGTRLIKRGLASELQGEVVLDFQPSGLVCTLDAMLPEEPADGWSLDLRLS